MFTTLNAPTQSTPPFDVHCAIRSAAWHRLPACDGHCAIVWRSGVFDTICGFRCPKPVRMSGSVRSGGRKRVPMTPCCTPARGSIGLPANAVKMKPIPPPGAPEMTRPFAARKFQSSGVFIVRLPSCARRGTSANFTGGSRPPPLWSTFTNARLDITLSSSGRSAASRGSGARYPWTEFPVRVDSRKKRPVTAAPATRACSVATAWPPSFETYMSLTAAPG